MSGSGAPVVDPVDATGLTLDGCGRRVHDRMVAEAQRAGRGRVWFTDVRTPVMRGSAASTARSSSLSPPAGE